jgi:hypothetical protein
MGGAGGSGIAPVAQQQHFPTEFNYLQTLSESKRPFDFAALDRSIPREAPQPGPD